MYYNKVPNYTYLDFAGTINKRNIIHDNWQRFFSFDYEPQHHARNCRVRTNVHVSIILFKIFNYPFTSCIISGSDSRCATRGSRTPVVADAVVCSQNNDAVNIVIIIEIIYDADQTTGIKNSFSCCEGVLVCFRARVFYTAHGCFDAVRKIHGSRKQLFSNVPNALKIVFQRK